MNSVIFKVVLKGNEQEDSVAAESITLTFKSVISPNFIKIPVNFISSLKTMNKNNKNIVNFQNIEEVITIGDISKEIIINYYLVILFSSKSKNERNGLLIANIKKVGDVLIGIWPFNEDTEFLNEDYMNQIFNDLTNNKENYKNIVIINPI